MKATWNDTVIAESDNTVIVEGNHYFPPASINRDLVVESETTSKCPWKGLASYLTIKVDDDRNEDAAWYYPDPKEAANNIKDHVAFWKGVIIS